MLGGELTWQPAGAGWSGESLRDRQPLVGFGSLGDHRGVCAVAALRDEQAEVQRGAGDPVGGVSRAPGPQLARRRH